MSDKLDAVIESALALSPVERASLIGTLYRSFQSAEERSVEQAWVEESERRIDSYEKGETSSVAYEEIKRDYIGRDR